MKFTDTSVNGTANSTSKIPCETASEKGYLTPAEIIIKGGNDAINTAISQNAANTRVALGVNLSTTGGANNVLQLDADGKFRTMAVNATTGIDPGNPWRLAAQQRIQWEDNAGNSAANVWMFPDHGSSHDANTYPELVWTSSRHCYYWTDGFQMGNSTSGGGERGWRFLYFNPLGQAQAAGSPGGLGGTLDTVMESIAVQFGGSFWNGSSAVLSKASIQYVPDGTASGELGFWIGGGADPGGTSARGRVLASSGHVKAMGLTPTGIKLPTGQRLTFGDGTWLDTASGGGTVSLANGGTGTTTASLAPTGNFTITQNSVPAIQSDATSAVTNSIRVTSGFVRVGTSGATGVAAFPFEVRLPGSGDSTAGEFYVDTNGTARVGRLSATSANSSGRLIVQDRVGAASVDFNAVTSTHTMSGTFNNAAINNFTNTTDSTSSTTGSAKFSGGVGIAKKLFVGTGLNVAAPTVPGSASATGTAGDISWDASYIYICIATNTWKRVAIATW